MRQLLLAHLILFTTSLIQGFNFSVAKIVMPEHVAPGAVVVIRGICSVVFFWLISSFFVKEKLKKEDFGRVFICAITGVALNQLLFYKGLNLTQPINASLMVTVIPVIVLIISAISLKERITIIKITGILIGAAGVVLLLLNSSDKGPEGLFIGDLLILINAASYAAFLVIVKPLMSKYHPMTVLKWMFLFGLFMVFPFGYEGMLEVEWLSMPTDAALALAFVIIFATLIAYTLNVGVLRTVNPTLAGIYIYLQPAMATIIAVLMDKDELTWEKAIFSLMILFGVFLVSRNPKKGPKTI